MAAAGVRVFVGLGSNLDDPAAQLAEACAVLAAAPWLADLRVSPVYRSPALIGPEVPADASDRQPDYLNAVVSFTTELDATTLLSHLQAVEAAQGRERSARWAPRTLDLDLLLFGDQILADDRLAVPHPGLARRAFVLQPLADLIPDLVVPGLGRLADLLAAVDTTPLERVD